MAAPKQPAIEVPVGERVVRVSNPDRIYFPEIGATKLDLVNYYLGVCPGIVNAVRQRPCMLHRFPKGVSGDKVHQKRVPSGAPHGSAPSGCSSLATGTTPTNCASPSWPK